jgi:Pyridoxamine 5'-phosphate oxidase
MPLSDQIKSLIRSAWDDGYPLIVATAGPEGPVMGPKGSMIVYDDNHLAYWERTKGKILDAVRQEPRVCILYANFKAQRDGVLESGFLRFFGTAELHESGPVRDKIFSMLLPREQTHAGADKGIGVLVTITSAADIRGKPIM